MGTRQTPAPRLTEEQRAVVEHRDGGLFVSAGAGSGKTSTLIARCVNLLQTSTQPIKLCVVSFTERSAQDLKEKFAEAGIDLHTGGHWITTLHGMCRKILQEFAEQAGLAGDEPVLDEHEARALWSESVQASWTRPHLQAAIETWLKRERVETLEHLLERARRGASLGVLKSFDRQGAPQEAKDLMLWLAEVSEHYERLKRARGVVDFDDLERFADQLLEAPDIQAHFQSRFDHVIVDEFQDTNPLQASIIRRMTRPHGANLMVVGDAKQSIYRFRDADVRMFESFGPSLAKRQSLTTNFRSRADLLEWINRVCAPVFVPSQIVYEPLKSGRPDLVSADVPPVVGLGKNGPEGHGATPEALAAWLHAHREELKTWSTALLLRRVRTAWPWLHALRKAGIPLRVSSGGWLWEDPTLRELASGVRAFFRPQDQKSTALFLRAPWLRVVGPHRELASVDRWIDSVRVAEARPLMEAFLETSHPVAVSWRNLRDAGPVRPGQLVAACLEIQTSEDDDRALPVFDAHLGAKGLWLWHRFEEQSYSGWNAETLIDRLIQDLEDCPRTAEPAPPDDAGVLRVMTVHASKGLEFDRVILTDFGDPPRAQPSPLLYWDRELGAHVARRDDALERLDRDPQEAPFEERERSEALHESRRLFYVALTRAKQQLVLVFPKRKRPTPDDVYGSDDWRAWVEASGAPVIPVDDQVCSLDDGGHAGDLARQATGEAPRVANISRYRGPRLPIVRPRHSATEWRRLAQCPRQYAFAIHRVEALEDEALDHAKAMERVEGTGSDGGGTDSNGANDAQELGTLMHAMMQFRDRARADAIAARWGRDRANPHGVLDWMETSKFWGAQPERAPVEAAWDELFFEFQLNPPYDTEVLVGGIDRVVKFADSGEAGTRFEILDYKILRRPLDPSTTAAWMARYETAMRIYEAGLTRLLLGSHIAATRSFQNTLQSTLLAISPQGVQTVEVPWMSHEARESLLRGWAEQARGILQLPLEEVERVEARPGEPCRHCAWRLSCTASAAFS